jgi:hypothetical protein
MTEPEKMWLDEHFPNGYIITVMQPRNVLTVMNNPKDLEGFTRLNEVIETAQELLSADVNPVVIEGHDL